MHMVHSKEKQKNERLNSPQWLPVSWRTRMLLSKRATESFRQVGNILFLKPGGGFDGINFIII